jgi:hypothetical protein
MATIGMPRPFLQLDVFTAEPYRSNSTAPARRRDDCSASRSIDWRLPVRRGARTQCSDRRFTGHAGEVGKSKSDIRGSKLDLSIRG